MNWKQLLMEQKEYSQPYLCVRKLTEPVPEFHMVGMTEDEVLDYARRRFNLANSNIDNKEIIDLITDLAD